MKADKKSIMIVVPGDKKVDTSIFKKLYQIKDLEMATKEQVKKIFQALKLEQFLLLEIYLRFLYILIKLLLIMKPYF